MYHSVTVYKVYKDVEDYTLAVASPRSWDVANFVEGSGFYDFEWEECLAFHGRMVEKYKEQITAGEMVVAIATTL